MGDLRTILDDALDRIKAEVFGTADAPGPDDAPRTGDPGRDHGDRPHGDHRHGDPDHGAPDHGAPTTAPHITGTTATETRAKTGSRMGRGGVKIGSCLVP